MPFAPLTLINTIVEPNGPGGGDGAPIPIGIGRIVRTREHRPSITLIFDPPREDLLGVDFDGWSDEQIEALQEHFSP